ncbi:SAVED domain-containing protein [Duganella sp. BJB488]|nr:SAVED domain-containing protein [Duganella sp. BJB489]RFP17124.1 SAVED domain-containing protein [Duganella sp. BJB488]RFP31657.1 SAVED domain-containing protein [Duganella sp. BJB480]
MKWGFPARFVDSSISERTRMSVVSAPAAIITAAIAAPRRAIPDDVLIAWLTDCISAKVAVTLVFARHRCALYRHDAPDDLVLVDPEQTHISLLKQLAKARMLSRLETELGELDAATAAAPAWTARTIQATLADIAIWWKARKALFDPGRGKPLGDRAIQRVWHDAGGRCMYRGCGDDLGVTPLTERLAGTAYLAHIVAADKDGPRGDALLSTKLADDPENIMLMCDKHHRLIDRIAEKEYPTEALRIMRVEHQNTVRKLLEALKYPDTKAIALFANIANATTWPSETGMRMAMINRGLKPMPEFDYPVSRIQRDDRSSIGAWGSILHDHEPDLRMLVSRFSNVRTASGATEVLAIFPLHLVPLLILGGRIVGQARRVEVFQFNRDLQSWDFARGAAASPTGTFFVDHFRKNASKTVLLSIELSAEFAESALAPELASMLDENSIQWIRIRARAPHQNVIAHFEDLQQFTRVAREAVNLVQDVLHADHVHLIGVAPASTLFAFGQVLQAGNHCQYTIYDRPDQKKPFRAAITIDGNVVSDAVAVGETPRVVINLR